jgi:hypothetical protein
MSHKLFFFDTSYKLTSNSILPKKNLSALVILPIEEKGQKSFNLIIKL